MAAETWDGIPATIGGQAIEWQPNTSVPGGGVPIRDFTDPTWVARRTMFWNGTAWEWLPIHYWDGSAWV